MRSSTEHWPRLNTRATTGLLCLNHVGGSTRYLRPIADALDGALAVHALRLPGRETLVREPPFDSCGEAVRRLVAEIQHLGLEAVHVLGLCGGTRMAWRLAQALSSHGPPAVRGLVVVDAVRPDDDHHFAQLLSLDDARLREHLIAQYPPSAALLDDPVIGAHHLSAYRSELVLAAVPLPLRHGFDRPICYLDTGASKDPGDLGWSRYTSAEVRSEGLGRRGRDVDALAGHLPTVLDHVARASRTRGPR